MMKALVLGSILVLAISCNEPSIPEKTCEPCNPCVDCDNVMQLFRERMSADVTAAEYSARKATDKYQSAKRELDTLTIENAYLKQELAKAKLKVRQGN